MNNSKPALPSLVGLMVTWCGTALLVSPAAGSLIDSGSMGAKLAGQVALWLILAAVLTIAVCWEKQPLTSLWLRTLRWQSVAWGVLLAVGTVLFVEPVTEWVRNSLGLSGYEAGMEKVLSSPAWFRVAAVITAGIVEEALFRGYAITRMAQISGSMSFAAVLSVIAFAALHVPTWGIGPSISFLIGGAIWTAFLVWQRDLMATMIAHIAVDAWALVIAPQFFEWWKR